MQSKTIHIPNMSCGHCKMRIEKALDATQGIVSSKADVESKTVSIAWNEDQVGWKEILELLERIGYPSFE